MREQARKGNKFGTVADPTTMPKNMQSKIKNWTRRFFNVSYSDNYQPIEKNTIDVHNHASRSIRFTVYMATGGRIIETQRIDKNTGDYIFSLSVVSNDDALGNAIEKILVIEGLR